MNNLTKKNKDKLIKLGLKKINNEINLSWKKIGELFNLEGEQARQIVKSYRYQNKEVKGKYEKGKLKFLILSDLHVPDHDEETILKVITENKYVDVIILNGDIIDCKAVSSFNDQDISILDSELLQAYWLLKKIRAITSAKIILVKGNHEQRVNREYAKKAKTLGTALVETEILYKLANGFKITFGECGETLEYKPLKNVYYTNSRSFVYGDLIVNHPSNFSKIPMRTVTNIYDGKLKDKYPNSRVCIIGHTHQAGILFRENNVVLIEDGCMCHNLSYAEKDDRPTLQQQLGYVYLEMKDGKVLNESIKLTYLGVTTDKYKNKRFNLDDLFKDDEPIETDD